MNLQEESFSMATTARLMLTRACLTTANPGSAGILAGVVFLTFSAIHAGKDAGAPRALNSCKPVAKTRLDRVKMVDALLAGIQVCPQLRGGAHLLQRDGAQAGA